MEILFQSVSELQPGDKWRDTGFSVCGLPIANGFSKKGDARAAEIPDV